MIDSRTRVLRVKDHLNDGLRSRQSRLNENTRGCRKRVVLDLLWTRRDRYPYRAQIGIWNDDFRLTVEEIGKLRKTDKFGTGVTGCLSKTDMEGPLRNPWHTTGWSLFHTLGFLVNRQSLLYFSLVYFVHFVNLGPFLTHLIPRGTGGRRGHSWEYAMEGTRSVTRSVKCVSLECCWGSVSVLPIGWNIYSFVRPFPWYEWSLVLHEPTRVAPKT